METEIITASEAIEAAYTHHVEADYLTIHDCRESLRDATLALSEEWRHLEWLCHRGCLSTAEEAHVVRNLAYAGQEVR